MTSGGSADLTIRTLGLLAVNPSHHFIRYHLPTSQDALTKKVQSDAATNKPPRDAASNPPSVAATKEPPKEAATTELPRDATAKPPRDAACRTSRVSPNADWFSRSTEYRSWDRHNNWSSLDHYFRWWELADGANAGPADDAETA